MALTASQIIEVKAARAQTPPVDWGTIARTYGVSATTIKMDVDPIYRAQRMEKINARRRKGANHGGYRAPKTKLAGHNLDGNNGTVLARARKARPNFATFSALPGLPPLPAEIPDMDDADIVGVDYIANTGCKYILGDRRGGPQNLPLCCGLPFGNEDKKVYCTDHPRKTGTGNFGRSR